MNEYILSCCSTVDLSSEYLKERNIEYICFNFSIDGTAYADDLGKTLPYEKFYTMLANGAIASTSQINIGQYLEYFEKFLEQGKDIIHVCLSTGISGTYNSASSAAAIARERYPERKIIVIDSLGASSGSGLLMAYLADMRDEGKSIEQLRDWAEENKLKVHHWFFSTDLTSYIRGGRVSKTAGFVGTILGICPLLNMDYKGRLIPRAKIRSKKRVIKEIVDKMEKHAQGGLNYSGKCFISNSHCIEDAEAVKQLVKEKFKNIDGDIMINTIGTTIGSHTGIGTVALFFLGDERVD